MQKEPPEVFYKKAIVNNFSNIHRKTPVLESLFNSEYCEIFNSSYFEEHLRTVASENVFMKLFLFHDWFPLEFLNFDQ